MARPCSYPVRRRVLQRISTRSTSHINIIRRCDGIDIGKSTFLVGLDQRGNIVLQLNPPEGGRLSVLHCGFYAFSASSTRSGVNGM
jgi:hypothetical protein